MMDNVISIEELHLDLEEHEISTLESNMLTLESYYNEIALVGAVSRGQMKVLKDELSLPFSEQYPLESFTTALSPTNLNVAMEGILQETARVLSDFFKKTIALLLKIVNWILDLLAKRRNKNKDLVKKVSVAKSIKAANVSLDKVVQTPVDKKPDPKLESNLEKAIEMYDSNWNDLVADILTHGPFSSITRNMSMSIFKTGPLLLNKLKLFDLVIHTPGEGDLADKIAINNLNTIAIPIRNPEISVHLKDIDLKSRGHSSRGEINDNLVDSMRLVFDHFQILRTTKDNEPLPIDQVSGFLASKGESSFIPFNLAPDETLKVISEIEKELKKIHGLTTSVHAASQVRVAFNLALKVVVEEMNAIQSYMSILETLSAFQDRLVTDLIRYEEAKFMLLREAATTSDDNRVINEVNTIQKNLQSDLKRYK